MSETIAAPESLSPGDLALKILSEKKIKSDKGADPDALLLDGRHKTERERNNG